MTKLVCVDGELDTSATASEFTCRGRISMIKSMYELVRRFVCVIVASSTNISLTSLVRCKVTWDGVGQLETLCYSPVYYSYRLFKSLNDNTDEIFCFQGPVFPEFKPWQKDVSRDGAMTRNCACKGTRKPIGADSEAARETL
jgi:hypothetical protein